MAYQLNEKERNRRDDFDRRCGQIANRTIVVAADSLIVIQLTAHDYSLLPEGSVLFSVCRTVCQSVDQCLPCLLLSTFESRLCTACMKPWSLAASRNRFRSYDMVLSNSSWSSDCNQLLNTLNRSSPTNATHNHLLRNTCLDLWKQTERILGVTCDTCYECGSHDFL